MYICPTTITSISLISSHYPERGISLISSHYDHEYLSYFSQLRARVRNLPKLLPHDQGYLSYYFSLPRVRYLSHFLPLRSGVSLSFLLTTITSEISFSIISSHYDHEYPSHFIPLRSRVRYHSQSFPPTHYDHEYLSFHTTTVMGEVSLSYLPTMISSKVSLSYLPTTIKSDVSLISSHYDHE